MSSDDCGQSKEGQQGQQGHATRVDAGASSRHRQQSSPFLADEVGGQQAGIAAHWLVPTKVLKGESQTRAQAALSADDQGQGQGQAQAHSSVGSPGLEVAASTQQQVAVPHVRCELVIDGFQNWWAGVGPAGCGAQQAAGCCCRAAHGTTRPSWGEAPPCCLPGRLVGGLLRSTMPL